VADTKTKFDYEIEAFELAFKDRKNLKIAIYGTGRMTATLLTYLNDFHIIGLLDRDATIIGKEMYGVRILSQQEAEENADIIIINTSETYWNTIYQRIHDWKIPIYFRNGKRASETLISENKDNLYWKKNYVELSGLVQKYDVVSFDIFDTLLMRKIYLPMDIFLIIENKIQTEFGKKIFFVQARKNAASRLNNGTIDEIYTEIQKAENWDDEFTERVKQYEIEVEKQFLTPRRDVVRLYNEIKITKEVFFVSDMYFTRDILKELLGQCRISISIDHIIVSCDYKKSKEDGTLWKYYADNIVKGKKALHIGDNEKADGEMVNRYGIDSYIVWSANKILEGSSIGNVTSYINSTFSSILIATFGSKLFNSPFALQKTHGRIYFTNEKEAGYYLLGSVMYIFCEWLFNEIKKNQVKKCAFFAREGYLLTRIFKIYCQLKQQSHAPEIIYMETSRRAVLTAAIRDKKDINEVAEFPYIGSVESFLYDRFGVSIENETLQQRAYADVDKYELENILERYEKEILSEARREKNNYMKYLESLGLSSDFVIIDSQLYGTTQYYLGKMLDRRLSGYYFCACLDETNKYLDQNLMNGCFPGKKELDGRQSSIYKNAAFIEAFFTAPNGMLECIEDDGGRRYAENKQNQLNFDVRLDMLAGIQEFLEEMIEIYDQYQIDIKEEDIYFVDKLFGLLMNNGFEPTVRMKNSFYYDNGILDHKEMPIWE